MELVELFNQNPWWKEKSLIENDFDIIKWNEKKFHWMPELVRKISLDPFALHFVLGPRQVGKTTVLKLLVKELLEKRDPKSIFFFNCENVADYKELGIILDSYFEFRQANGIGSSVILFDEVTFPKEWYRAVKSRIDTGMFRNDVLIFSGSTSIAIKREVELFPGRRGKGNDHLLLPLSFRGYLNIVDKQLVEKIKPISSIDQIKPRAMNAAMFETELNAHLETYVGCGGFPLSISAEIGKEEAKRIYLAWIKNAVLKSDRSDLIARQVIKVLVECLQTDISWEGVSKKIELKSPKTVAAYVDLLKSIFVVNVLYNVDLSGKRIMFGKNKKIHFRDPLLLDIFEDWCLVKARDKRAAVAEFLVVEHLSRLFPERVFFWKNGSEVDAVVLDKNALHGFEVKSGQGQSAYKVPVQLKSFFTICNKPKSSQDISLSVFLSLFDV